MSLNSFCLSFFKDFLEIFPEICPKLRAYLGGGPTDDISVIVKATGKDTNSRKTATVTLDPEMSIREVKQRITGVMRLPDMGSSDDPDIRIILAGRELDDRVTVGECDLGNQVSQLPH